MTATLTKEQVTDWADRAEQAGIEVVWAPTTKPFFGELMYDDLTLIGRELHRRRIKAACLAFDTTPAVRQYMAEYVANNDRGLQEPKRTDWSWMAKTAQRTTDKWGKKCAPYKAKGGCQLRLKLKEAVHFTYTQEAYADYSTTLVPVEGDLAASDLKVCQENLSAFVRFADSHTGMAGSGSNYEATLVVNGSGALVVISQRASIAD